MNTIDTAIKDIKDWSDAELAAYLGLASIQVAPIDRLMILDVEKHSCPPFLSRIVDIMRGDAICYHVVDLPKPEPLPIHHQTFYWHGAALAWHDIPRDIWTRKRRRKWIRRRNRR